MSQEGRQPNFVPAHVVTRQILDELKRTGGAERTDIGKAQTMSRYGGSIPGRFRADLLAHAKDTLKSIKVAKRGPRYSVRRAVAALITRMENTVDGEIHAIAQPNGSGEVRASTVDGAQQAVAA